MTSDDDDSAFDSHEEERRKHHHGEVEQDNPGYLNEEIDEEFHSPKSRSGKAGRKAAAPVTGIIKILKIFVLNFVNAITRVLPIGHAFWRRMFAMSLFKLYSSSGGDAVNFVFRENGWIDLVPVKYGVDEQDTEAWLSKGGDEKWYPSIEGNEVNRLGNAKLQTPVVFSGDDPRTTNPMEARMAEALEFERHQPVMHEPNVLMVEEEAGQRAVADGGNVTDAAREVNVLDWGREHDVLVDAGTPDGFDGQAWSVRNYAELMLEKATSEEMERQYQYGRMAMQDLSDKKRFIMKVVAAFVLGLLGIVFIFVFFGGGGGGSSVSFTMQPPVGL